MKTIAFASLILASAAIPAFAACQTGGSVCSAADAFSQRDSRPADSVPDSSPEVPGVRTLQNGAQVRVSSDGKWGVDKFGRRMMLGNRR